MACGFSLDRSLREVEAARGRFDALRADTWVVDGNAFFSRPGPRLVDSVEIMAGILSPGAVGPPPPPTARPPQRVGRPPGDPPNAERTQTSAGQASRMRPPTARQSG